MIEPLKSKALTGTKKALGQLKKVLSMIEKDAYCMDIIQQMRAVEGLMSSVLSTILESHLQTCAQRAFTSKDEKIREQTIQELITAFKAAQK